MQKKKVVLQFLYPLFPLTRFSLALVSKLTRTADVFCTSLWRPPGYIARRMYVNITFMLQNQSIDDNARVEGLV